MVVVATECIIDQGVRHEARRQNDKHQVSLNVLERRQRAAAEFMAWADHHAHLMARMEAARLNSEFIQAGSAQCHQQQVWARRKVMNGISTTAPWPSCSTAETWNQRRSTW